MNGTKKSILLYKKKGTCDSMIQKKDLFQRIDTILMESEKPSVQLNELLNDEIFYEHPFKMLASLKVTEQSSVHHPEGDAWIHTIMVVDEAAKCKDKSTDPHAFMWAAMLHDIGKPKTTRNRKGKITAYDHDRVGAELAREFLIVFISDRQFIERVVALVRWHMQILYVVNDLPFKEVQKMKDEVSIKDISLLGWCDRIGRKNSDELRERNIIESFYTKVTGEYEEV